MIWCLQTEDLESCHILQFKSGGLRGSMLVVHTPVQMHKNMRNLPVPTEKRGRFLLLLPVLIVRPSMNGMVSIHMTTLLNPLIQMLTSSANSLTDLMRDNA